MEWLQSTIIISFVEPLSDTIETLQRYVRFDKMLCFKGFFFLLVYLNVSTFNVIGFTL